MRARRPMQGIALWELLLVVTIAALLVAVAAPGFGETRRSALLTASVNQMVGALHFARSASILGGIPTVLCLSADGIQCAERAGEIIRGWLIFEDSERSSPPRRDPSEPVLRQYTLPFGIEVHASRLALTYWPTSRSGTTGTFTFCTIRPSVGTRDVIISQTGRPRVQASESKGCTP